MGLGLKVAMALPSDGVAYNISRNNEYIQKISNRNGSITHIAGNTYAHPFSTQQAIGTIHIDAYIYISYIHICLGSRACPNDLVQRQPSERSITLKSPKGHSRIRPNSWIQALSVHTCDTLGPSANPNVQTAEFKATVRTASWPCCCKGDRSPTAHSKGIPVAMVMS